jgi:hypothetical protein
VVNRKQKVLVLEPEKEKGESGDRNVGTLKAISHNYDEWKQTLVLMVIIDECLLIQWRVRGLNYFLGPYNLDLTFLLISLLWEIV